MDFHGGNDNQDSARAGLAWLAHSFTVIALVLLLVNDRWLKVAYPGLLTGKLSDIAGLVLAPPVLALFVTLFVRKAPADYVAAISTATVGVGFAVVKLFPAAATVASSAWTVLSGPSLFRADPTDLLVLPALGVAWFAWTRARHRPAPGRVTWAVRVAGLLPVAVFSLAASSLVTLSIPVAAGVGPGLGDDAAILVDRSDSDGYLVTATSADGLTWHSQSRFPPDPTAPEPSGSATPSPSARDRCAYGRLEGSQDWRCANYYASAIEVAKSAATSDCEPDGRHCYRVVVGRLAIEESNDGGLTWVTGWSVSDRERDRYATNIREQLESGSYAYHGDVEQALACTAVYVVPENGVVVGACGLLGFARRDAGGRWDMIGLEGLGLPEWVRAEPLSVVIARHLQVAVLGWLVLWLGAQVRSFRRLRPSLAVELPLGIVASALGLPLLKASFADYLFGGWNFTIVLFSLLAAAWLAVHTALHRSFPWGAVPLAVLATVGGWLINYGITEDRLPRGPGLVALWVMPAIAAVANIVIGLRYKPRPPVPGGRDSRPPGVLPPTPVQ